MKKLTLAYVAGLFDGEGCFQIVRHRTTLVPRVLVVNTNREILEMLKSQFGGDIHSIKRDRAHWKTAYQWRLSNAAALEFLERIERWLVIKREQALLALAFASVRPGLEKARWDFDTKELLVAQSKYINYRGMGRPDNSPMEEALH